MALRVLSIDGGGIRGIIPATVLVELERLTGRRIYELFDLLVGTSTGGILSLALTCAQSSGLPRTAAEIRSLYLDRGWRIFPLGGSPMIGTPRTMRNALFGVRTPLVHAASVGQRIAHFMGAENIRRVSAPLGGTGPQGNARYPAGPLEEELQLELGEARLSSALRPIAVVSCDFQRGIPLVFRGGGLPPNDLGDALMWHAARATSAGPTFFPAFEYTDPNQITRHCVDGGIVANDPAFLGFMIARELAPVDDGPIVLVSLGTGEPVDPATPETDVVGQLLPPTPWWKLLGPLSKLLSGGPGILMRELLVRTPGVEYHRLQPDLAFGAVHAMDDATPENTAALRRTADEYVGRERDLLSRLAEKLSG